MVFRCDVFPVESLNRSVDFSEICGLNGLVVFNLNLQIQCKSMDFDTVRGMSRQCFECIGICSGRIT